MAAVCPVAEPARFIASSPAIGHACSLTRIRVEAADGAGVFCSRAASLECCLSYQARSFPARRSLGIVSCSQSYSERPFFVRRTPRACHAVCLRCSTLEPVFCARKEEADIKSLSTTGRILAESLVMQGDFFDTQTVSFGFYATSRHCIPRLSPRNSNLDEVTANNALQRTAPAVTVAAILARISLVRSWRFLTSVASFFVPPSQLPRRAPQWLSLSR